MNMANEMFFSSEKFLRIQQLFKTCTPLEQLYTTIELTRTLQISYQHFLIQLFQINIKNENNVLFNHTLGNANSPDIVNCLLSDSLDRILSTIPLFLPLVSSETFNEKLFNAYRNVLMYLDANLSAKKFTLEKTQVIQYAQQICFYIQTNEKLQRLASHTPKLFHLAKAENFFPEEQTQYPRQPLQRFQSIRSQVPPLMNFSSEGTANLQIPQQLTRHETNDSGVDLTEPSMSNFLSQHHPKYSTYERHPLTSTTSSQKKHLFVGKTASSPIPEHASIDGPIRVPLKGVLSAPPSSTHPSDSRQRNSPNHHEKNHREQTEEEEEEGFTHGLQRLISEENSPKDTSRPLGQFYSQRFRTVKPPPKDDVSQYLGVETSSAPVINTFTQPNSGMKDVQAWLKHLRLHKYGVFFSRLTYDEMMNLTGEQLKDSRITEGACTKILLNIKRLKERSATLNQYLTDYTNGQIDLPTLIQQLSDLLTTPIRSKQLAKENQSDEDIPKLFVEVLEKIFQQLPSYATGDVYCSLLLLVDRCYKHEAFNEYAHLFLQWRRRLSNIIQSFGRLDFRSNPTRRSLKSSVRPMKSFAASSQSSAVTLSKYNSEPQNNSHSDSNFNAYPSRSPPHLSSTYEESPDMISRLGSSPNNNQGAYLVNQNHQRLARTSSIIPSGGDQRMKLCKTYSDPHKIRSHNLAQPTIRPPQNLVRMTSSPYSHQPRQYISRSPPASTMDTLEVPSMKKCHSDNERMTDDYSLLPHADSDDQQHPDPESDLFCRQITNNAIGDDATDGSMDYKETSADLGNLQQSSNTCTDMEQW